MQTEEYKASELKTDTPEFQMMAMYYRLFEQNEEGKKFIQQMRDRALKIPVFPVNVRLLVECGNNVDVYSGFKAGQLNLLYEIDYFIQVYKNYLAQKPTTEDKKYDE